MKRENDRIQFSYYGVRANFGESIGNKSLVEEIAASFTCMVYLLLEGWRDCWHRPGTVSLPEFGQAQNSITLSVPKPPFKSLVPASIPKEGGEEGW